MGDLIGVHWKLETEDGCLWTGKAFGAGFVIATNEGGTVSIIDFDRVRLVEVYDDGPKLVRHSKKEKEEMAKGFSGIFNSSSFKKIRNKWEGASSSLISRELFQIGGAHPEFFKDLPKDAAQLIWMLIKLTGIHESQIQALKSSLDKERSEHGR